MSAAPNDEELLRKSFYYPMKDGTVVYFKPLEKSDREKVIDGFKKLSAQTIYKRFFGYLKELSDDQLDKLLDTNSRDHIAWGAFDFKGDEPFGIGVGRFWRSAEHPNEAELALTVIDDYQGKGVGTVLLCTLYCLASMMDIDMFTGNILSDNMDVIRRFSELGAELKLRDSEYLMRLPVHKNPEQLPDTKYANLMKTVSKLIKEKKWYD